MNTGYLSQKSCHNGPVKILVFKSNKCALWAGGFEETWAGTPPHLWALRIALGNFDRDNFIPHPRVKLMGCEELIPEIQRDELIPAFHACPIMGVDWHDQSGADFLTREWFASVISLLNTLPEASEVFVHCYSGHGRTGTFLAIIGALSGACPKDADPVEWIRGVYCDECVETREQIRYIEAILGRKITATPSNKPWSGGAGYLPHNFSQTSAPSQTALLPFPSPPGTSASGGDGKTGKASKAPCEKTKADGSAIVTRDDVRDWYAGDAWIRREVADRIERESSSGASWVIAAWSAARKNCRDIGAPRVCAELTFTDMTYLLTSDLGLWDADVEVKYWWDAARAFWQLTWDASRVTPSQDAPTT